MCLSLVCYPHSPPKNLSIPLSRHPSPDFRARSTISILHSGYGIEPNNIGYIVDESMAIQEYLKMAR